MPLAMAAVGNMPVNKGSASITASIIAVIFLIFKGISLSNLGGVLK